MEKYIRYQLVESHEDFQKSKDIILEYLKTLNIDLSYMNVPEEFKTMDQKYSGNEGVLILALDGDNAIGCVGVRKIEEGIAELKRLYVRDSHRGLKVGITLLEKALASARRLGYKKIRLDVIPTLHKAKELYHSFGFYNDTPVLRQSGGGNLLYGESILLGDVLFIDSDIGSLLYGR